MTTRKSNQSLTSKSSLSPAILALALVVLPAALPALSGQGPRGRPTAEQRHRAALASMSAALAPFASGGWAPIAARFAEDPGGAADARLVVVGLSLANADLDRFELSRGPNEAERTRALERLEEIVLLAPAWTLRSGSGGAAVYLALTVRRLQGECGSEVGADRVDALRAASDELLRAEAAGRRPDGSSFGAFPEELADSAAAFAGAAVLLPATEASESWEAAGRELGGRVLAGCASPETLLFASEAALSYQVAGRGIPIELSRVPALFGAAGRCRSRIAWSSSETFSGDGVAVGDETASVLAASRAVTVTLLEHFLWIYPPGTACGDGPLLDE
jgi:hypothetical protein